MPNTLNIALVNNTTSSTVFAYITGSALQNNNALFLLQSDGKTYYYPTAPSAILQPLGQDCGIPLGPPGSTVNVTIPQIAGGRIWFSVGKELTFLLNPGPALVAPSVTNPSDLNIATNWGFCEFTFNQDQLYANISYVDFVSIPIALTLTNTAGATQSVAGMAPSGLSQVCAGLQQQSAADRQAWSTLIFNSPGTNTPLRVLSPNNGIQMNRALFAGYYEPYVDLVWAKYSSSSMTVNTHVIGSLTGNIPTETPGPEGPMLTFSGPPATSGGPPTNPESFNKPTTADIFSCSTGPFATGADSVRDALIPRLAAAFNRSTLLTSSILPASVDQYYLTSPTNHYSRIVHAANIDGRGYAFPYDDVQPADGPDQSGAVNDAAPQLLTITVGGGNAGAAGGSAAHATEGLRNNVGGSQAVLGGGQGRAGSAPPAAGQDTGKGKGGLRKRLFGMFKR